MLLSHVLHVLIEPKRYINGKKIVSSIVLHIKQKFVTLLGFKKQWREILTWHYREQRKDEPLQNFD
jgi:hypothetical protein